MSSMNDVQAAENEWSQRNVLNEINFCLSSKDTVLSGPSLTKLLNSISNQVFKAIIIGDAEFTNDLVVRWESYASHLQSLTVIAAADGDSKQSLGAEHAFMYFTALKDLMLVGENEQIMLQAPYEQAYKRLLTMLKNAGCRFDHRAPCPTDKNLCLSILDLTTTNATKTKVLNQVSNIVTRGLLYGDKEDRAKISDKLRSRKSDFMSTWANGRGVDSQESLYYDALVTLLREGPAAVTRLSGVTTNLVPLPFPIKAAEARDRPNPVKGRLFDAWSNAYSRVLESVVRELGSRTGVVVKDEALSNFVNWERSLRNNLTDPLWNNNPIELTGDWISVDMFTLRGARDYAANPLVYLNENLVGEKKIVTIRFGPDGSVFLPSQAGRGLKWRFIPGPAHLDTLEFQIVTSGTPKALLTYTGYIDRGQRIESRFSGRPIRMIGRVVLSDRDGSESDSGDDIGLPFARVEEGSAFVMELKRG